MIHRSSTQFRRALSLAVLLALAAPAFAVSTITSITTTFTAGTASTSDGKTFDNNILALESISVASSIYAINSLANNVFVRRNSVNNNQSSVWYADSGTGTNLRGVYQPTYDQILLNNNLFSGTDNTFANGTVVSTGNIERLDFTWNSGLVADSSLVFAVFDRGDTTLHDSFAIAAVTSIDGSGNPTGFGSLLTIPASTWGNPNVLGNQDYRLFRYNNGSNLATTTADTERNTQGLGGILISGADLGIADGTTIFGYALTAADVTATTSAQLLDWTNATFYPTTTDGTTGGGGIDLASVNGLEVRLIPEPSTFAALSLGTVLLLGLQRRRRIG